MPKIYTKTGDAGETSLLGKRVEKNCAEVVALGEVDELNAALGVLISLLENFKAVEKKLVNIQHNLFIIGSNIAAVDMALSNLPKLKKSAVLDLENWIDEMHEDLPPLRDFILPGGSASAAQSFFARAVCRRAERAVIFVKKDYPAIDKTIGQYLNRLSDALFVLARWLNKKSSHDDIIWRKK